MQPRARKRAALEDKHDKSYLNLSAFNHSTDDLVSIKPKMTSRKRSSSIHNKAPLLHEKTQQTWHRLEEWTIKPCSHYCALYLEGHRSGDPADIYWMTSMVNRRVDSQHLVTVSGHGYQLVGDMYIDENIAADLSEQFLSSYKKGFPRNWKHMLAEEGKRHMSMLHKVKNGSCHDILENVDAGHLCKRQQEKHTCQPTPWRLQAQSKTPTSQPRRTRPRNHELPCLQAADTQPEKATRSQYNTQFTDNIQKSTKNTSNGSQSLRQNQRPSRKSAAGSTNSDESAEEWRPDDLHKTAKQKKPKKAVNKPVMKKKTPSRSSEKSKKLLQRTSSTSVLAQEARFAEDTITESDKSDESADEWMPEDKKAKKKKMLKRTKTAGPTKRKSTGNKKTEIHNAQEKNSQVLDGGLVAMNSQARPWTKQEITHLNKVMQEVDKASVNFWAEVAGRIGTRSEQECESYYHQGIDQYMYQTKKQPAKKVKGKPEQQVKAAEQITGKKGTLKRKLQLKEYMDNLNKNYEDDCFDSTPLKTKKPMKMPKLDMEDSFNIMAEDIGNWKSPGISIIKTPSLKYPGMPTPQLHEQSALTPAVDSMDRYVHKVIRAKKGRRSVQQQHVNNTKENEPESPMATKLTDLLKAKSTNSENTADSDEEFDDYFSDSEK